LSIVNSIFSHSQKQLSITDMYNCIFCIYHMWWIDPTHCDCHWWLWLSVDNDIHIEYDSQW